MRILFVAMSDSIHTARWISAIDACGWDIHLFPSIDCGITHPFLKNVSLYHSFYGKSGINRACKKIKGLYTAWDLAARGAIKVYSNLRPDYRSKSLVDLIKKLKPDVIHSLEIQAAGYLTLEAKKILKDDFPPWIITNWGSDIYLFGRLEEHRDRIRQVLENCDYYSCECLRDAALAKEFGFNGKFLPVFPNSGGFDLKQIETLKRGGKTSKRRIIMLKGYQGWSGRALAGLRALERCKNLLEDYTLVVFSPEKTGGVEIAARLFSKSTGIPVKILNRVSHDEILKYHGQARISIGLSISDGISTSMLEAMVMGSFPIQSNTACADEWISDGNTGILVPPEDTDIIEKALRQALTDDDMVDKAAEKNWQTAKDRLDQQIIRPQIMEIYKDFILPSSEN